MRDSVRYWSTMTLTTIGYGDFVPQNEGERVFTICAMFVGAFIYAQLVACPIRSLIALPLAQSDR